MKLGWILKRFIKVNAVQKPGSVTGNRTQEFLNTRPWCFQYFTAELGGGSEAAGRAIKGFHVRCTKVWTISIYLKVRSLTKNEIHFVLIIQSVFFCWNSQQKIWKILFFKTEFQWSHRVIVKTFILPFCSVTFWQYISWPDVFRNWIFTEQRGRKTRLVYIKCVTQHIRQSEAFTFMLNIVHLIQYVTVTLWSLKPYTFGVFEIYDKRVILRKTMPLKLSCLSI